MADAEGSLVKTIQILWTVLVMDNMDFVYVGEQYNKLSHTLLQLIQQGKDGTFSSDLTTKIWHIKLLEHQPPFAFNAVILGEVLKSVCS
jgi:hypothetical protein